MAEDAGLDGLTAHPGRLDVSLQPSHARGDGRVFLRLRVLGAVREEEGFSTRCELRASAAEESDATDVQLKLDFGWLEGASSPSVRLLAPRGVNQLPP